MVLGLLLIVGSMVAGGFALAAADHTVSYWSTRASVHEGDIVTRSDFTSVQAKVPKRTAETLIRTNAALPHRMGRMVWARSLRAGTLISRGDLTSRSNVVELPVTVPAGGAPAHLRTGDLVDVWVSTGDGETATKAAKMLSRARVVSRANSGGFDGGPATTVVVDAASARVDGALVAALSNGRVTLVRVG